MAKEAVRVSPIPQFSDWVAGKRGIGDLLANRGQLPDLYAGVENKDFTIIRVNGELRRYCRVPEADIFYQIGQKRYKVRETGYEIKPERLGDVEGVLEEVESGNMNCVTFSRSRDNSNSISERSKLTGESREVATVRMVHEELFRTVLEKIGKDKFPHIKELIRVNLDYGESYVSKKGPDEKGNSFKGLPVVYFMQPATITFTPEMHVPIRIVEGVPQNLYELEEERYINVFVWDEVDSSTQ